MAPRKALAEWVLRILYYRNLSVGIAEYPASSGSCQSCNGVGRGNGVKGQHAGCANIRAALDGVTRKTLLWRKGTNSSFLCLPGEGQVWAEPRIKHGVPLNHKCPFRRIHSKCRVQQAGYTNFGMPKKSDTKNKKCPWQRVQFTFWFKNNKSSYPKYTNNPFK